MIGSKLYFKDYLSDYQSKLNSLHLLPLMYLYELLT